MATTLVSIEKKLIRYGDADSVETLAADAAKAEHVIGIHGVSVILRKPPSFPHRQAEFEEAARHFKIVQTGHNQAHHTVELPKPVTQAVVDLFNSAFTQVVP